MTVAELVLIFDLNKEIRKKTGKIWLLQKKCVPLQPEIGKPLSK
jgi:hypothetical protein